MITLVNGAKTEDVMTDQGKVAAMGKLAVCARQTMDPIEPQTHHHVTANREFGVWKRPKRMSLEAAKAEKRGVVIEEIIAMGQDRRIVATVTAISVVMKRIAAGEKETTGVHLTTVPMTVAGATKVLVMLIPAMEGPGTMTETSLRVETVEILTVVIP